MKNIIGGYWPPNRKMLLFTTTSADKQNHLISDNEYFSKFKANELYNRKILRKIIEK